MTELLENIEDLRTYNILFRSVRLQKPFTKKIPFSFAYEEFSRESSVTIEQAKDIFKFLTSKDADQMNIPR